MTSLKALAVAGVCSAVFSATAVPAAAHDHRHQYRTGSVQHIITVSCYRGPWDDVIWDRPNPVFTDSLVSAGYSFPQAHAIAERVCRDPSAVGSPGALRAIMGTILATTPPGR